jgi:hypothetical protein
MKQRRGVMEDRTAFDPTRDVACFVQLPRLEIHPTSMQIPGQFSNWGSLSLALYPQAVNPGDGLPLRVSPIVGSTLRLKPLKTGTAPGAQFVRGDMQAARGGRPKVEDSRAGNAQQGRDLLAWKSAAEPIAHGGLPIGQPLGILWPLPAASDNGDFAVIARRKVTSPPAELVKVGVDCHLGLRADTAGESCLQCIDFVGAANLPAMPAGDVAKFFVRPGKPEDTKAAVVKQHCNFRTEFGPRSSHAPPFDYSGSWIFRRNSSQRIGRILGAVESHFHGRLTLTSQGIQPWNKTCGVFASRNSSPEDAASAVPKRDVLTAIPLRL